VWQTLDKAARLSLGDPKATGTAARLNNNTGTGDSLKKQPCENNHGYV